MIDRIKYEIPDHIEDSDFEDAILYATMGESPEFIAKARHYLLNTEEGIQKLIEWTCGYEPSFQDCTEHLRRVFIGEQGRNEEIQRLRDEEAKLHKKHAPFYRDPEAYREINKIEQKLQELGVYGKVIESYQRWIDL